MTKLAFLCATALMSIPGAAVAQSNSLELVIGGEAYDGPPKFEVLFNGQPVGESIVATAIDTATVGRFADAAVKTPYLQTFTFAIPDAAFDPMGEVRLRFLNEAYGGDGSNRDRNLYLATMGVNGRDVPAADMRTMAGSALEPNAILGDYLVIFDGTADAVALAPDEGWPGVEAATAETPAPVVEPEPVAPVETEVAATPAGQTPGQPVVTAVAATPPVAAPAVPVVEAAPAAEVAAASPQSPAPTATAEETVGMSGCALDQLYNVIGFNENSNELTPRLQERLDQILGDIGDEECVVSVIGYSSTVGDFATNALFAVERAQNVLNYLRDRGLKVAKATATGVGETDQFGPNPSDNRRVVITVTP